MNAEANTETVLVLTVGTGYINDLEGSLYAPLLKSIETGRWDRVYLLPSQGTCVRAEELKHRVEPMAVRIRALPDAGDESDADTCFAHFDAVLAEIIAGGCKPQDITLDFTRGTKAMSAALVLAGVGRGVPRLRYIGGKRGPAGRVRAGKEEIREVRTVIASARQRLGVAEHLMQRGDFEAVCTLLGQADAAYSVLPDRLRRLSAAYNASATVYAAWDRFDYQGAARLLNENSKQAQNAGRFAPTEAMVAWMSELSKPVYRRFPAFAANQLRYLACDLLANAERRVRDGAKEDAAIRCYRVLELIGQFRLFDKGLDSGALSCKDPRVKSFQAYLEKKKSRPLSQNTRINLRHTVTAGRFEVARFLKHLEDPFGKRLLRFDGKHVTSRNTGLLIHGFESLAAQFDDHDFEEHIHRLECLLLEDEAAAESRLAVARSLDFSRR